jgi:hypothetical protein
MVIAVPTPSTTSQGHMAEYGESGRRPESSKTDRAQRSMPVMTKRLGPKRALRRPAGGATRMTIVVSGSERRPVSTAE